MSETGLEALLPAPATLYVYALISSDCSCRHVPSEPSLYCRRLQWMILTLTFVAHVKKIPTSCFQLHVFQLKKLNERYFNVIGLVLNLISKQKTC